LSVLLRYTDSDYRFGIFKLFIEKTEGKIKNGQSRDTAILGKQDTDEDKQNTKPQHRKKYWGEMQIS
jgi:hypothetical protein